MKRTIVLVLVSGVIALAPVLAQNAGINAHDGLAIKGYDPVAYFADGKAAEGNPQFTTEWQGVTWQFASAENRDLFVAEPERYAPEYGGYCAWAVGRGDLVDIDPNQWIIEDERLFLNYSGLINLRFKSRLKANIKAADENWPIVRSE